MAVVQTFAYEDLTVSSTAVGFTAATYSNADWALAQCEGGPVRFRLDGGTPTSSVGMRMNPGDIVELESREEVKGFKAIRIDGTSGTLRVQYGVRR